MSHTVKLSLFTLFITLLFTQTSFASDLPLITFGDLQKGLSTNEIIAVDSNSKASFEKNRIPGAIFFDSSDMTLSFLPKNKSKKLVFYCKNPKCMASHMAANMAKSKGYKNVWVFSGGIEAWMRSGGKTEPAS